MSRLVAMLLLTAFVAGCAGGSARHADQNRDYARNCGDALDQLGLCRPFSGGIYTP